MLGPRLVERANTLDQPFPISHDLRTETGCDLGEGPMLGHCLVLKRRMTSSVMSTVSSA